MSHKRQKWFRRLTVQSCAVLHAKAHFFVFIFLEDIRLGFSITTWNLWMRPFFCIIKTEKYRELEIDKNNLRLVDKVMHYDRVVPGRLMKWSFQVMHLKQCSFFIKITNTILCKVEKLSHLINGWNICLRFGRAIIVAWPAALFC